MAQENRRELARQALEEKLHRLPEFQPLNNEVWAMLSESMRAANQPVDTIERWGRLMQAEVAAGNRIADIATPTLMEADYGDMPDLTFIGVAVPLLHQVWGDLNQANELMRWYTGLLNNLP